jgi:tRNA(fMet)-specific endonuclease VapC
MSAAAPWMLDSNVCIHLINRRPGYQRLLDRFDRRDYGEFLISAITLAELEFGVAKSERGAENRSRLEVFLARFEIEPFDARAAAAYGKVRAALEKKGTPIGPLDTEIAAHAIALQATLVTNNVREFSRVAGLKIENWLDR